MPKMMWVMKRSHLTLSWLQGPARVEFEVREVKSENKKLSLFFEKCKVKKMLSLFFEECKVKKNSFTLENSYSRETIFLNRFLRGWAEPKTKITGWFRNLLILFWHPSKKKVQWSITKVFRVQLYPIVMEGQEFRNVPVYRGGVKVPMKRPDFSQYNIFQFYPPGLCLRLGWYRVWCWSLRPWFVFEAFCVLCLCELRWQLFNLLNLRLTFQLFPQSWPSSSCSKRRESPSLPRRCLIQISNSKKNSMIYRWFHRIELFPTSG